MDDYNCFHRLLIAGLYIDIIMFRLGKNSEHNMVGVDYKIVKIIHRAIEITKTDFCILETGGYRTAPMQYNIFKQGFSKCDGYNKKSYHQTGNAIDPVPFIDGKPCWTNKQAFIDIHNAVVSAYNELKGKGEIPEDFYLHYGILWNWKDIDNDGIIEITDRLGWDCAHIEARNRPQKI